jgi:hypothetical protein
VHGKKELHWNSHGLRLKMFIVWIKIDNFSHFNLESLRFTHWVLLLQN